MAPGESPRIGSKYIIAPEPPADKTAIGSQLRRNRAFGREHTGVHHRPWNAIHDTSSVGGIDGSAIGRAEDEEEYSPVK